MYPRNREMEMAIFDYVNDYIEKNNSNPSYRDSCWNSVERNNQQVCKAYGG